ncbi:MAG: SPOR domain-containing protein [Spirochaetaceae bacterium]|nr:SPOR domain-containing protein [Spirochaetaceae bacterium]
MTHLTKYFAVFVAFCAFAVVPILAADINAPYIADEIRAAAAAAEKPSVNTEERHDAYTRLARLLQLSLDVEGAAVAWKNAAYAIPEKRDDTALAQSAVCYFSMGNWEEARSIVKLLLLTVRDDTEVLKKAVYLNAQIDAFDSGSLDALYTIAGNPEYADFHPTVYYTLWQVGGKNEYKTKLVTEFPDSPEACISDASKLVSITPHPYWLLFPGRETTPDMVPPPSQIATNPSRSLQAGLYKEQENADLQATRLKGAGYNAIVTHRLMYGTDYWAVSVIIPDDDNVKTAMSDLKTLGFETFPER